MTKQQQKTSKLKPWLIWGLGAFFFFLMYLPRVAPGVLQPQLMAAFNVHGLGFGALTAFFLYAYIPMQLPVGMLYDRFGTKRIMCVMTLVAGLGCVLFGAADGFYSAGVGRFITGFGGAFGFVGAMKLARDWFPSERFGFLAGFTQALGMLGAAFGEGPIAAAVEHIGWRHTFYGFAISFLILAVLIICFTQDKPVNTNPNLSTKSIEQAAEQSVKQTVKSHGFGQILSGLLEVIKNKQAWLNAAYLGFTYAPIMAFAEAWGVSFLKASYGLDVKTAAFAVGLIFVGWAIGGPVVGALSDLMGRRKPLLFMSSIIGLVIFIIVLYCGPLPLSLLYILMFLFGFTNTGVGVAYAISGEIVEQRIAGTSIAFANMASILLGMGFEPMIGALLDHHSHAQAVNQVYTFSAGDYRYAMVIIPCSLVLSFVFALLVKESYDRPYH